MFLVEVSSSDSRDEFNSDNFEYKKIYTMFDMSLSSDVNWNYESEIPMNITTKYDGKSFWRHNSDIRGPGSTPSTCRCHPQK